MECESEGAEGHSLEGMSRREEMRLVRGYRGQRMTNVSQRLDTRHRHRIEKIRSTENGLL